MTEYINRKDALNAIKNSEFGMEYDEVEALPFIVIPEETIDICIYDSVEEHPNCTVQILRNSVTGKESIGWFKNE